MSKENKTDRKPYELKFEPVEFSPIGAFKITTSSDLGKLANEVFKQSFVDYEGIIFDPGANGAEPTFELIFNHGKYEETDDTVFGVKSAIDADVAVGTNPLDKLRRIDNICANGAKYYATEDLKDVVTKLLVPSLYKGGNIKWNQIVVEYAERSPYQMYNNRADAQYTKIRGISAKRLAAFLFGFKTDNDEYDYDIRVIGQSLLGQNANFGTSAKASNWVLQISRASLAEVTELYKAYGFNPSASNIIR